jgi:WD40 repeat protein
MKNMKEENKNENNYDNNNTSEVINMGTSTDREKMRKINGSDDINNKNKCFESYIGKVKDKTFEANKNRMNGYNTSINFHNIKKSMTSKIKALMEEDEVYDDINKKENYDKDQLASYNFTGTEDKNNNLIDKIVVSYGIQLKNNNILISLWDKTLSEYEICTKTCINFIKTECDFIHFLLELKDERILFTSEDNARIYIIQKKNNKIIALNGHTNTVIKAIENKNGNIISASCDGTIKFWERIYNGNFNCSMTVLISNDYIRNLIWLNDGRILISTDEKKLIAVGFKNYFGNFVLKYLPDDRYKNINKSFQIIDNCIK